MKKWKIITIALLGLCPTLMAADQVGNIVVHFRDNTYRLYKMEQFRRIDMDGADLVIEWGEDKVDRYARSAVSRVNFRGDTTVTSIGEVPVADAGIIVMVSSESLVVSGLKSSADAYLFDLSGVLMMSSRSVDNGDSIDISALEAGIYVVELSNGQSFKFMKR